MKFSKNHWRRTGYDFRIARVTRAAWVVNDEDCDGDGENGEVDAEEVAGPRKEDRSQKMGMGRGGDGRVGRR